MYDHQSPGPSPCPVRTARLAAITASSLRCPGRVSRVANPHHSTPTAEYHRSSPTDDEFHASIRPLGSSPNYVSLAFSQLNRLRFSGSLHHSPSIQLHLQHDSMVDDQSTPTPRRLQGPMCTVLNQPRAIALSKPHKHSCLCHVFPRPRSRSPSASRSYVVVADPTTVFCTNRHPSRSVRLACPTKPILFGCTTHPRLPNHLRRIFIHHIIIPS